ncbi:hypothetical protein EsH8_IV_001191 [Colletotrichum jinshuiense]
MPNSGNVRRPGCESCRARHIKCDKGDPCGQCVRKGRACVRGTKLKFRHITLQSNTSGHRGEPQYEFSPAQKWCRVSGKRLRFIDETSDINSIHNDGYDSEDDVVSEEDGPPSPPQPPQQAKKAPAGRVVRRAQDKQAVSNPVAQVSEEQSPLPIERGQPYPLTRLPALHPHPAYRSPSSGHLALDDPPRTISPIPRSQFSGPICSISEIGSASLTEDPSLPEPRRSFRTSNLPLQDHREAALIRHFLDFIAPPFDYGDPDNRFTTLLPQHAAVSPALLNAVLAVSAKSNDTGGSVAFFDKPADHYFVTAMDLLEPVLINPLREAEEADIAAAVLLRLYQSIDIDILNAPKPPVDLRKFVISQKRPEKGSLAESALWAWIRLEIFRAVMRQEELKLGLEQLDFDRSLKPADDEVWAWRMVLHTVDIVSYCFSETKQSATYHQLATYAAKWMRAVPESFMPIFMQNPPYEGVFPEILLINDSVMIGLQFYHLNRILLTAHNPNLPRLGKNEKEVAALINKEIIADIKILCGIANGMDRCNPAHITACMGIALAGYRFNKREEQEAIYDFFIYTAEEYAWDTTLILNHLREAWGWPETVSM